MAERIFDKHDPFRLSKLMFGGERKRKQEENVHETKCPNCETKFRNVSLAGLKRRRIMRSRPLSVR